MTTNEWWMLTTAVIFGTFSGLILFSGLLISIMHDKCFRKFRRWVKKLIRKVVEES